MGAAERSRNTEPLLFPSLKYLDSTQLAGAAVSSVKADMAHMLECVYLQVKQGATGLNQNMGGLSEKNTL